MEIDLAKVQANWPRILEAVREGISLRATCEALGIPRAAVWEYRQRNSSAASELRAAWEIGADALVDDIDSTILTTRDARLARVRAEFIWKRAASANPDRYADRQKHDHRVVTFALADVIAAAQARLDARSAPRVIDSSARRVDVPALLAALM
jgi:hypothetical protein